MIFGLTLQPLFSQSVISIAIESSNMSGFSVKTDSEWRRAATRDPKAIDDGLQSCITDTRVTRAISSDVAFGARRGGSIATTTKVVPASYIHQLMKSLDFIVLPLRSHPAPTTAAAEQSSTIIFALI